MPVPLQQLRVRMVVGDLSGEFCQFSLHFQDIVERIEHRLPQRDIPCGGRILLQVPDGQATLAMQRALGLPQIAHEDA